MNDSDREAFVSVLRASMEVYDKTLSADALRVWWATLGDLDLTSVRHALTEHIRRSPYAPKPADVLGYCRTDDGRPGAEEAWAMIPKDEHASVVWTEEMAAAFGSACPLIGEDDIAARVTFKEVYEKEVDKARKEGKPVKWAPSFGRDKLGREAALNEAVEKNRLPSDKALQFMPESEQLAVANDQPRLEHDTNGQNKVRQLIEKLAPERTDEDKPNEDELLRESEKAFAELNRD